MNSLLKWLAEFAPYYPYVLLLLACAKWMATTTDQSLGWQLLQRVVGGFIVFMCVVLLPIVLAVDATEMFGFTVLHLTHKSSTNLLFLNVCALGAAAVAWLMLTHPEQWWSQPKRDPADFDFEAARDTIDGLLRDAYNAGAEAERRSHHS